MIIFAQMIAIPGTSQRADRFARADGWSIDADASGVTLSRVASQNVPAVPAFRVVGIGYCLPIDVVPSPVIAAPLAEAPSQTAFGASVVRGKRR